VQIYALLVVIECVSLLSLCVISLLYARSSHDNDATSVEYTSVTAMVSTAALLYFSLDAILLENIFQFAAAQIMHMLIVAYVAWHYAVTGLGRLYDRISLYVMIGVCAFQLAYLVLWYPVAQAFGWRLYKKLGSSAAIRPLYKTATIFFTLLKLDFALGLILLLLAAFYLLHDAVQIALNALAMFFTLCWLLVGFQFVQRESPRLAPIFFLFAPLEPIYLIYKLWEMKHEAATNHSGGTSGDDSDKYPVFSWDEFLLTGCVACTVRAACILFGLFCWRNFGKGLKEKMFSGSDAAAARNAEPVLAAHSNPYAAGVNPAAAALSDEDDLYTNGAGLGVGTPHATVTVIREQPAANQGILRSYLQPLL